MNAPAKPKSNAPAGVRAAAIAAAIVASLFVWESSNKRPLKPYRDIVGVLTVCNGITGSRVIEGKTYTEAECDALEADYVARMVSRMGECVTVPLKDGEWVAYGHWAYNVGTSAFCNSSLVRKLNAGDHAGACRGMAAWTWVTKNGKKVNCRDPANRCGGLPARRDYEVKMCLEAL